MSRPQLPRPQLPDLSYIGELDMVEVAEDSEDALAGGVVSLLSLLIILEQALTAIAMAAAIIGKTILAFDIFPDMIDLHNDAGFHRFDYP